MHSPLKIKLTDLNPHLTCIICNGYFVNATTITECLHSFCRSCIVKYLETNKYCPICEVQIHKTKPLLNLRSDQTLQDIVYKLVPGLFQNEMQRRKTFYASHPNVEKPADPELSGELSERSYIYTSDDYISLSLEYYNNNNNNLELPRRYLRCPAAVSILHLQKLIRSKYGLTRDHKIDILYQNDALYEDFTLIDVAYIYLWKRKGPLHLTYRIFESLQKEKKLFEEEVKEEVPEIKDENRDEKIAEKEVQLQISETGVISVTTSIESSEIIPPTTTSVIPLQIKPDLKLIRKKPEEPEPKKRKIDVPSLTNSTTTTNVTSTPITSTIPPKPFPIRKIPTPLPKTQKTLGYKTLRDPPKTWNPTLPPKLMSPCYTPTTGTSDTKPKKFFKVRNNMPRYLGNPASGVKPMYQIATPVKKTEPIRSANSRNSPMTVSEMLQLRNTPKTTESLKITQTTVPIYSPKIKQKPKSPPLPLTPTPKNALMKVDPKDKFNFIPPNPYIPNLSPNLFSNYAAAMGSYDPRLLTACHHNLSLSLSAMLYNRRYAAAAAATSYSPPAIASIPSTTLTSTLTSTVTSTTTTSTPSVVTTQANKVKPKEKIYNNNNSTTPATTPVTTTPPVISTAPTATSTTNTK